MEPEAMEMNDAKMQDRMDPRRSDSESSRRTRDGNIATHVNAMGIDMANHQMSIRNAEKRKPEL